MQVYRLVKSIEILVKFPLLSSEFGSMEPLGYVSFLGGGVRVDRGHSERNSRESLENR